MIESSGLGGKRSQSRLSCFATAWKTTACFCLEKVHQKPLVSLQDLLYVAVAVIRIDGAYYDNEIGVIVFTYHEAIRNLL